MIQTLSLGCNYLYNKLGYIFVCKIVFSVKSGKHSTRTLSLAKPGENLPKKSRLAFKEGGGGGPAELRNEPFFVPN
jgi:hypothetical protein